MRNIGSLMWSSPFTIAGRKTDQLGPLLFRLEPYLLSSAVNFSPPVVSLSCSMLTHRLHFSEMILTMQHLKGKPLPILLSCFTSSKQKDLWYATAVQEPLM